VTKEEIKAKYAKIIVKGRCNATLPKSHPNFCQGDCCHYCGEDGYGSDIRDAVTLIGTMMGIPYSIREFAKDFSYNGVYKTDVHYWSDNHRNPKGLLGGCRFQNPDGSCQLYIMDKQEDNTKKADYFTTVEPKYYRPAACRRFPTGEEDFLKERLRAVGDKYPLNRIWKKCGYFLEMVEE